MPKLRRGRIKIGTSISQDFGFFTWPNCCPPATEYAGETYRSKAKNPNMVFDVERKGSAWECRADGYGRRSWKREMGGYGNGSILTRDIEGIDFIGDD